VKCTISVAGLHGFLPPSLYALVCLLVLIPLAPLLYYSPSQEPTQDDYDRETSYVLAEDLNQTLNQVPSFGAIAA
jgi:hypothetical protein